MKKRKVLLLPIMLLCTMLFAGCHKENPGQGTSKQDAKETNEEVFAAGEAASEGAYFTEQEIGLPEEFLQNNEKVLSFIQNEREELELYGTYLTSGEQPVYTKYTLSADGTWRAEEPEWLNDASLGIYSQQLRIFTGEDKIRFAVFATQDGQYHLIKTEDEIKSEEIEIDAWKTKNDDYYPVVNSVAILKDGLIAATLPDGTCQIIKDGKVIKEFSGGESFFLAGAEGKIVCLGENNTGIIVYHAAENSIDKEISMEASVEEYTPLLQTETTYIANSNGISRLDESSKTWVKIIDGADTMLNNPAFSPRWLYKNTAGSYFVFFISSHGSKLTEYSQSTEAGLADGMGKDSGERRKGASDTLTIYALNDSRIIRSAISNFKTSHPEVTVDFQVAETEENTAARSEIIRALNARLFAGDGADILLLDGLPADSYVEKGVLYDMGEIITQNDELYPGIREAYKQGESCYMFPVRIGIPVYAGTKEVIAHTGSLEELADFASQTEPPYFIEISYHRLVENFYPYYSDMFIRADGQIDKDGLADFLTQIKKIADNVPAAETVETQETPYTWPELAFGKCSLSVCALIGGMDLHGAAGHYAAVDNIDGALVTINDMFEPHSLIGINNAGANKELALEFVKETLSEEIQCIYFLDEGFPVNRKAAKQWQETDKEFFGFAALEDSDEMLSVPYPNRQERDRLFGYISNLKTPVYKDEVLLEMIVSEADSYFKGEESIEKTVEKIVNNASLYIAE